MKKTCNDCGIEKSITEYCKHTSTKDKLSNFCRDCTRIRTNKYRSDTNSASTKRYEKTIKGYLVRTYRNMKSRVTGIQKLKSHLYLGMPILDKQEFYEWALSNSDYKALFENYINTGCNMKNAPSIDRINPKDGYLVHNMRWLTHSENSRIGARWSKNKTT